jgi:hypothetical protein
VLLKSFRNIKGKAYVLLVLPSLSGKELGFGKDFLRKHFAQGKQFPFIYKKNAPVGRGRCGSREAWVQAVMCYKNLGQIFSNLLQPFFD